MKLFGIVEPFLSTDPDRAKRLRSFHLSRETATLGSASLDLVTPGAFYAFYPFYAWWIHFPQSGALAEGTARLTVVFFQRGLLLSYY